MCVVSELLSSCTSGQLIRCSHKEAVRDTGCGGDQRRPPEQRSCPQASPEERGDEEERGKGQRGSATAWLACENKISKWNNTIVNPVEPDSVFYGTQFCQTLNQQRDRQLRPDGELFWTLDVPQHKRAIKNSGSVKRPHGLPLWARIPTRLSHWHLLAFSHTQ